MPEADDLVNEYLNNDKVKIIHILYDLNQVYSCSQWSDNTNSDIDPNGLWPFIATDSSDEYIPNDYYPILDMFFDYVGMPNVVFLNHDLEVYAKQSFTDVSNGQEEWGVLRKKEIINQMLVDMEISK